MFLIVASLITENHKSALYRRNIEEGNRVIYCVAQEIKYNITMEEILSVTSKENITLAYYSNFLKDLCDNSLLNMQSGNGITISTSKTEDVDKIYINIRINLDNKGNFLEKTFIKYKWMEYYDRN